MPATSPAQERHMQAAAHAPGGYGGLPQAVGKEFTDAAGIAFTANGKTLLMKRNDTGEWAFPTGKVEAGETPEQAARREVQEETGYAVQGALRQLAHSRHGSVSFTTFGQAVPEFTPALCAEHSEFVWAAPDEYPEPLHPGVALFLGSSALDAIDPTKMNELQVARAIMAGELTSPQRFGAMALFAMRVTGTGTAYRQAISEHVYRPPENYLSDEFLQRCNGLAVIFQHPKKNILNSEEFADRAVGSIFLPYIQGNEVWGVAKIYDDEAIELMCDPESPMSTSPSVVFRSLKDDTSTITLENGEKLLIEGEPSLLDHLAICPVGVWDKGGGPAGILLTNEEATKMTEEELKAKAKADADEEEEKAKKAKADAAPDMGMLMDALGALSKRMDSMEEAGKPKPVVADSDEGDEEKKKAKADAEKAEQAKADSAFQARVDAAIAAAMPKPASDADQAAMADSQARADSVAHAFGDSAPRPLQGETPLAYRRRLAGKFKQHSAAWKDVDLAGLAEPVVAIAEAAIYADALTAARNPSAPVDGGLREIRSTTRAGHSVSTFVGNPGAWMGTFKSPVRRVHNISKGN